MIKKAKFSDKLLVKVYSTENEVETSNYAVIDLTETFIQKVRGLKQQLETAKKVLSNSMIHQLSAFENNIEFIDENKFGEEIVDDEVFENFTNTEVERIEFSENEKIEMIRDDTTILYVSSFGFKFSTYIKNSSIRLDTATISFDFIS